MYRLLHFRIGLNSISHCLPVKSANSDAGISTNLCSYCKNTLNSHAKIALVRHQSNRAILTQRSVSRKFKFKHKKYVELLEISEKNTNETKASVSKLKAKHLTKLASSPEVTLSQLHKLTKSTKQKKENVTATQENSLPLDLEFLRRFEEKILGKSDSTDSVENESKFDNGLLLAQDESKLEVENENDHNLIEIKDSYDKFRRENFIFDDLNLKVDHYNEVSFDIEHDMESAEYDNLNNNNEYPSNNNLNIQGIGNQEVKENFKADSAIVSPEKPTNLKKTQSKKQLKAISKRKAAEQKYQEYITKSKEVFLLKLLRVHLEICIFSGGIEKAYKILLYYRNKKKKIGQDLLKDVNLYNIILSAFASQGNYKSTLDLLNVLKEDNVALNLQTYAILFECVERSNISKKYNILQDYSKAMNQNGFTLNDLVNKCRFIKDQQETVISAIKRLEPDFEPIFTEPELDYQCVLLNNLNPDNLANKSRIYNNKDCLTSPANNVITPEKLEKAIKQQIENEINGIVKIKNVEVENEPSEEILEYRKKLSSAEKEWMEIIKKSITRNLTTLKAQSNASYNAFNLHPYLMTLEPKEYVDLIMQEIRMIANCSETYSPGIKFLQRDLGLKVYYRYQIKSMKRNGITDKSINLYKEYIDWYLNKNVCLTSKEFNARRKWQRLLFENMQGVSLDHDDIIWPPGICLSIGKFLYDILHDLKIDLNILKKNSEKPKYQPLIYNILRGKGKYIRHELKPHPLLPRLTRLSKPEILYMDTILVPSLCPPRPWSNVMQGGYVLTKTPIVRMPFNDSTPLERLKETETHSLYPAMDSLNQLGSIPWIINKPVLDVLLQVFRTGGSISLNVPKPASSVKQPPTISSSMTSAERAQIMKQRASIARVRQEMHSLWCESLYKLSLANHFRDSVFWLPHNMDFRGRVYPCPPHLSHLGSDTSRALMIFAKGQPLGPKGLSWLKLHCVNLTGTMKKSTIDERMQYAESVMDDILDSANKPLEGRRWWAKSEDPWQTLAACKEIANAINSGDPEGYICHFPVHQDGSCNGLQHYAALGGDTAGAFSVNLSRADRPQDVYSAVVTLVEAARARDAAQGDKIAQSLEGFVNRKVIKQTIMTTVYGVTKYGARLQIAKKLKDTSNFPKENVWFSSYYLSNKTFESLREMFTSTKEIQDWFTDCAKQISGICGEKVEWITPLGLPVIQPYTKLALKNKLYKEGFSETVFFSHNLKPCIMKQKNAFPPNFIHSLDATHMMLTSLHCEASDITYVSVHDCFWTHPSSVEIMNKICREQFVVLHSQPILESLSNFMVEKYSFKNLAFVSSGTADDLAKRQLNVLLQRIPKKGNFNLQNVLESVYFFS